MSTLDVVLLAAIALAGIAGFRVGFIVRAGGVLGLLGGLLASAVTVPPALEVVAPATAAGRVIAIVAVTLVTILVVTFAAQAAAGALRRAIDGTALSAVDRVGGAAIGAIGVLVVVWFVAPLAGMVPGAAARQVRGSAVVSVVTDVAPAAPNPLASLQTLLADSRFPEVFSNLRPAPVTAPPPGDVLLPPGVVDMAAASSVKVEVAGCASAFSGSGWTVGDELVVTNAHVVAGADDVQVRRPDGSRLDARVVVFDDDRDLALLRVAGLGLAPLPLGVADAGEDVAAFGHPGGSEELRVAPARVEQTIEALGRDIYGLDPTTRAVVVVAARLAQGDSGSALVDAQGAVVGTVFAISPDDPDTSYALANDELQAVLASPRRPGVTGRCS